ncbi:HNH endonuclease [Agromyces sp. SYSU K20354]|uniref:HNH endonuclease signature motif containing protein n=1 Tax=Agromyces cavernae TaxID=2898659 RepID=UPI001E5EF606|nr:HNH endonuclease signature motif containing protein [Agromyces cavernae]MCD2442619.1 HNH endonuclease [Agromyces cavernae]
MTTPQPPEPAPAPEAALDAVLVVIERLEREIRAAQAEQMRQVAAAHRLMHAIESHPSRNRSDDDEFVRRAMAAELATTLRVHERSAGRMLHDATELDTRFIATRDALAVGTIGLHHVRQLLDTAHTLPEPRRTEFEASALDKAAKMTPPAFRRAARRLRERLHPIDLVERHAAARTERHIALEPEHDDMAWLHLHIEAERGAAIVAFMRRLALRAPGDDPRTVRQREVDCAVSLLLGRSAADANDPMPDLGAVRPEVYVTVPVLTLLGLDDEPGELDGLGPIDAATARRLASHAPSFHRILTHPETGAYLSYGRDTYRVPSDLAGYLRIRDGGCRFPGCTRRAVESDIDHTRDWQHAGHTSHRNLAHLCRQHHRLKHHTGWRVQQLTDGRIQWTSPAGRVHLSEPEHFADPPRDSAAA